MKQIILLVNILIILLAISCNRITDINKKDVPGCYVFKKGRHTYITDTLFLFKNYTSLHKAYRNDSLLVKEKGEWSYYSPDLLYIKPYTYYLPYTKHQGEKLSLTIQLSKTYFSQNIEIRMQNEHRVNCYEKIENY
jgi:hypothetical protein